MHARVTTGQFPLEEMDEAVRIYNDDAVPAMREQRGFEGVLMLVDRETGKGISISLWSSEAEMLVGEQSSYYRTQIAKFSQLLLQAPDTDHFEVAVHK